MQYTISDYATEEAKQLKVSVRLSKQKNKKLDIFKIL